MGLCSLRAAGVRSVLGAQRCAPAACSTAAPSPGVQARAHTRQPWELASTEPALTASPPAAVPAQRGQRGRQCRQAAVETQSLNGPSAGGAANTVWPPPGRRELLGAARDLQAGSGAGRRRVGSLEVEDIVSREREACIEDQAARTRHGGDLCAAYLQPDAGEEVPHGRPASWLHHAAHCGPAQCAGDRLQQQARAGRAGVCAAASPRSQRPAKALPSPAPVRALSPYRARQEALWEAARLRVTSATLAAENDALRAHARRLAEQARRRHGAAPQARVPAGLGADMTCLPRPAYPAAPRSAHPTGTLPRPKLSTFPTAVVRACAHQAGVPVQGPGIIGATWRSSVFFLQGPPAARQGGPRAGAQRARRRSRRWRARRRPRARARRWPGGACAARPRAALRTWRPRPGGRRARWARWRPPPARWPRRTRRWTASWPARAARRPTPPRASATWRCAGAPVFDRRRAAQGGPASRRAERAVQKPRMASAICTLSQAGPWSSPSMCVRTRPTAMFTNGPPWR